MLKQNSITALAKYFGEFSLAPGADNGWIGATESFWAFWDSLTDEEVDEFLYADLSS